MISGNNNIEHLSPYKATQKLAISPISKQQISAQFENSKKLESLIRGMLLQNDIEPRKQNLSDEKMLKVDQQQPYSNLCQDAVSLNKYLDIKIRKNDQFLNHQNLKDEPALGRVNILEQTILAQKQDIIALQEIEKSKAELQKRIKQRYSVLRSISTKTRSRKMNAIAPYELLSQGRPSFSNPRGSTLKYESQQNHKLSQHQNDLKKNSKKHNMTTLLNPSTIEYYSGRISSILYNQNLSQKSPTVLAKESLQNQSQNYRDNSQNQSSILSAKKVQRIQKKKIVIKDSYYSGATIYSNRGLTPQYIRKPLEGAKALQGTNDQQPSRPKSNGRTISQQSQLRSGSANIKHLRNRSGQMLLKSRRHIAPEDNNETPSVNTNLASIFQFSPQNMDQKLDQLRPESVSLLNNGDAFEGRSISSRYQMLQSKEFSLNERLGQQRLSQQSSIENPQFNLRQKLNFRYVSGENQYGTINSEREQEELLQTRREDDIPNRKETNTSVLIPTIIEHNHTNENDHQTEYVFNTPSNNFCDGVFQSSIIAANRMKMRAQWKDQAEIESAGLSKTTMSTQRPLMSGGVNSYLGNQQQNQYLQNNNKLFSKAKIISYQKGRFSSDCSFLKLRQTTNNQKQRSILMDGEDSECKFDENDKIDVRDDRISHDQVVQINEEEEFVEDEDSKNSNLKNALQPHSEVSTSRQIQVTATRNAQGQSLHQEDSHCNMLASFESAMQSAHKRKQITINTRVIGSTQEQMAREQLHSDDEVSVRRGLEQSSFRSQIPYDPELLRQSTHSLLNRKRAVQAQNLESNEDVVFHNHSQYEHELNIKDEEEVEMQLFENSYESFLKNADNF